MMTGGLDVWGFAIGVFCTALGGFFFTSFARCRVEVDDRTVRHWGMVSLGKDEVPREDVVGVEFVSVSSMMPSVTLGLVLRDGETLPLSSLSWYDLPGFSEPRRSRRVREVLGYPVG